MDALRLINPGCRREFPKADVRRQGDGRMPPQGKPIGLAPSRGCSAISADREIGYIGAVSEQDVIESGGKKAARRSSPPEGLRPIAFLRCLVLRHSHDYVNSKSKPGYLTCVRCRYRQRNRM